jgi:hypothetical protein
MYRARGAEGGENVDFDALTEMIARVQRLSRRVIVGSLVVGVALGVAAVALTLETYQGFGGKILGARLGFTFLAAFGGCAAAGIGLRKLLLRGLVPQWMKEMGALGVSTAELREALAPFLP